MPKVVVPLDACNQVVLQVDDFKQLQDNRLRSVLLPMMQHFATGLASDEGSEGVLVYDALAAYFLIQPKAFTLQKMDVVIETKGEHTFGMSVAEKRPNKVEKTNVDVVVDIGDEVFKKEFFEILDRVSLNP